MLSLIFRGDECENKLGISVEWVGGNGGGRDSARIYVRSIEVYVYARVRVCVCVCV